MSKIGIHSFVWSAGSSKSELEKALTHTHELGFDLIELSYSDPDQIDVRWLADRLRELKLDVAISMGLPPQGDISSDDPSVVARGTEDLKKAIALTRDLGGTKLAGILYAAHGKSDLAPTRRSWETSVSAFAKVAEHAKPSGVTLNLEVANRFESNMLNTVAQGLAYLADVGASNVFLHLDTFHMNIEEADIALAIRHAGDKLGYVHIGESHRGYLGTGTLDFVSIFDALEAIGWQDYVTFESFSSAIVDRELSVKMGLWRDLWADNVALARHAHAFIEIGRETAKLKAALLKTAHLP